MYPTRFRVVNGLSFSCRLEVTQIFGFSIVADARMKSTFGVRVYTFKAASIIALRLPVHPVLRIAGGPQIDPSIVRTSPC